MADVTPDPIMRIALGFMAAKHLFVASAVGLFEALNGGPATLDELASKCGVPHRTLGISADAMASLGLVERDGDRYRNSAVAEAFLAGASGPDLRPMLRFWDRISYPAWQRLEAAIRSGEGQYLYDRLSEEEQRILSAGVEAFTAGAGGRARERLRFQFAPAVARHRRRYRVLPDRDTATLPDAAWHVVRVARGVRGRP